MLERDKSYKDYREKIEKESYLLELTYEELIQIETLLDVMKNLSSFNNLYKENEVTYLSVRNKLNISQEEVFYRVNGVSND